MGWFKNLDFLYSEILIQLVIYALGTDWGFGLLLFEHLIEFLIGLRIRCSLNIRSRFNFVCDRTSRWKKAC
jgi:hypothetical protein